ncbi:hypothetical protein [Anaeromassilibacillus sp. SJQ-1]
MTWQNPLSGSIDRAIAWILLYPGVHEQTGRIVSDGGFPVDI